MATMVSAPNSVAGRRQQAAIPLGQVGPTRTFLSACPVGRSGVVAAPQAYG